MAKEISDVLSIGIHLVFPSKRLANNPITGNQTLVKDTKQEIDWDEMLNGKQGVIFIETLSWGSELIAQLRKRKIPIVCIPMWEWFRGKDSYWKFVDLFICVNRKSCDVVKKYGYKNTTSLPWTINLDRLPKRKVKGYAKLFIHNAGIVDVDDRKGTQSTIDAFSRVKRTDIKLKVRIQKHAKLHSNDPRIEIEIGNFSLNQLYQTGDVAIQPSKLEGLGFMVLEPVCCGIPTITTVNSPMNDYVLNKNLRCKTKLFKKKSLAYREANIKHAHLREPSIKSLANKIDWCTKNDVKNIKIQNREWAENTFSKKKLTHLWQSKIGNFFAS